MSSTTIQLVDEILYETSVETQDKEEGKINHPKYGDGSMNKKNIFASSM